MALSSFLYRLSTTDKERQIAASFATKFYDGEGVNMQKNRWATIYRLLKWVLPSYTCLLFSLIGLGGSIATTHGMNSIHFPTQFSHPFNTPTPTPTLSPTVTATPTPTYTPTPTPTPTSTPVPTPIPTPIAIQPPKATLSPQVQPTPSSAMFPIQIIATPAPATATPISTPASLIPTATTTAISKTMATKTTLTNQPLQNIGDGDKVISTLMLPLSVGGPLLLISGGTLWFVRRRQYKPALQGTSHAAQASLWVSSRELDPDLDALSYITGASGALPVPIKPQTPYMPTLTSQLSFTQPAYTPIGQPSTTTALPLQMFTTSSNEADCYLQDNDLLPLSMDALNLPLQPIETRESNKHTQILPLIAPSMTLMDSPISSMSSLSLMQPVVSLPVRPPSTKDDLLLGEVMRQAQMGLFVVLGREKHLTNLHTNH